MKKLLMIISVLVLPLLVIAGGDFTPVMEVSRVKCKTDKVFIDKDAKLMWEDQLYRDAEDGAFKQNRSIGKAGGWRHARDYCRRLNYFGFADWRLPTSDELQKVHRIEGQVFRYFRGMDFWTSTPASRGKYYVVYPADAYIYERKSQRSNYIRCVRCLQEGDTKRGPALVKEF